MQCIFFSVNAFDKIGKKEVFSLISPYRKSTRVSNIPSSSVGSSVLFLEDGFKVLS